MTKRVRTVTKAQAAKLEKLWAEKRSAQDAIFEFNGNNVSFGVCYERASTQRQINYDNAARAISTLEQELILTGRGWMDGRGQFRAY